MYQRNSAVGLIICIVSFLVFGLFFAFRPFLGLVNFFPFFPAIIIFIAIIIVAVAGTKNSKQRNGFYHKYPSKFNIQSKNPYVIQKHDKMDIKKEPQEKIRAQFCQYCGTRIDKDAQYCHNCGTKLIEL